MSGLHEGGCLCGAIRYRVRGQPLRASACHCTFCQRRTGTAFALVVAFDEAQIELSGNTISEYEHRSDESRRWIRLQFCSRCGTTVTATIEKSPGVRIISGGTFDDPNWVKLERHIWTRSAQRWMTFPPNVERFEEAQSP